MGATATPQGQGSLRQRSVPGVNKRNGVASESTDIDLDALVKANQKVGKPPAERDFKIGFAIITALAFLTRFWGISHPKEVVFDEVHFGKVGDHAHAEGSKR